MEYTDSNGYTYTTDEYGRIESVSGSLKKQKGNRNQNSQKVAGREDRKCKENNNLAEGEVPDDGGHLIATIFNGSGDLDNLVAMNRTLNRGDWKSMELSWKNALENKPTPKKVEVWIEPYYEGTSQRPTAFYVKYKIEGEEETDKIYDNY